jgi:hypothetical protein
MLSIGTHNSPDDDLDGRGTGSLEDLRQQAAEEAVEQAEHEAVVDLDELPVDRDAALEQLHREPDDDQPAWRQP